MAFLRITSGYYITTELAENYVKHSIESVLL